MKELVEVIAKALVDCPDEVVVIESTKGEDTVIAVSYTHLDVYKRQAFGWLCWMRPFQRWMRRRWPAVLS